MPYAKCSELIKRFEGFQPKPYVCPAGYWTIGYGTLCTPEHPPINKIEAEALMVSALNRYASDTFRLSPVLLMESEDRQVAIMDFIYNLGATRYAASTLRRKLNKRDWGAAAYEIGRWVHGSGRVLPGLVIRRGVEAGLLTG